MHGIVFTEFQHYIERGSNVGRWHDLLHSAYLDGRVYTSLRHYPDKELFDIIEAASKMLNKPEDVIVEDFGAFIAPDLLGMYAVLIKPDWRTLDVIEHTETVIHSVVRINQVGSSPPQLKSTRLAVDEIEMIYDSPRKLCNLAKGIIRGIAAHYDERIQVLEYQCMHLGARACVIRIRQES